MNNIGKDGNGKDRALGEYWEDRFIELASHFGWEAWPFSRKKGPVFYDDHGNKYISPDVWVLKKGTFQYVCEVKHKNLARNGCYGFEVYREESMLAIEQNYRNQFGGVEAIYVVHNHDLAGGKNIRSNNFLHWHAGRLSLLAEAGHVGRPQKTYWAGRLTDEPVPMKYYPYALFRPIQYFLDVRFRRVGIAA